MSTLSVNTIQPLSGTTVTISSDLTVTGNITGNVSGSITNATTASYIAAANVDGTVANATTASYALSSGGGGSTNTSSLLITSSFLDPNLTFEKGDGSTFDVDISTLTVANATSASYAATSSYYDGASIDATIYFSPSNANGDLPILLSPITSNQGGYSYPSYDQQPTTFTYNPGTNTFKLIGVTISSSLIPTTDGVSVTSSFSLGSPTNAWKDIYVSNGTINFLDGAGNVQGTLGTGTNATVITGSLQVVPINLLTGFTTTNGTLLHKSYTTADCAFSMFDSNLYSKNPQIYYYNVLNDGVSLVLPWDKKITAYSLVNNTPIGEPSTSTVVSLPPIYNAGYSTGETVTVYNLGKTSSAYKDSGSIYLVGNMQGVTNVNTSSKQITGTFNQSYVLSGSWGNYTQINISNSATTSSIKLDPGQKATFEIVYWGTIFATPSASMNDFTGDGYHSNFTNVNPSTTYTRYLFKGIENL